MDLYFSPLACSMASRIALYEAGGEAAYLEVDGQTKAVQQDGSDFLAVNPLGLVPTLRTDDGAVLTENAAILQYIAEQFPGADLGARDAAERSRLQQWLCFVGTELHKALFVPLLDKKAPEGAKQYAVDKGLARLDYLNGYLTGREFLLDRYTVADAYLATVLNWSRATPQIDFARWPAIKSYLDRQRARPAMARALGEEFQLYQAEMARRAAA